MLRSSRIRDLRASQPHLFGTFRPLTAQAPTPAWPVTLDAGLIDELQDLLHAETLLTKHYQRRRHLQFSLGRLCKSLREEHSLSGPHGRFQYEADGYT